MYSFAEVLMNLIGQNIHVYLPYQSDSALSGDQVVVERVDAEPSTSGGSVVALEVSEAESPGTASRHVGLVESDSELQVRSLLLSLC